MTQSLVVAAMNFLAASAGHAPAREVAESGCDRRADLSRGAGAGAESGDAFGRAIAPRPAHTRGQQVRETVVRRRRAGDNAVEPELATIRAPRQPRSGAQRGSMARR